MDNINVVYVRFLHPTNTKKYAFKTFQELKTGDLVVVEAAGSKHLALVATPPPENDRIIGMPSKWVIDKVDFTGWMLARGAEEHV